MPFLISVRESIRINSNPISDAAFAKYFFEVWDKLSNDALQNPGTYRPGYNQFLTLLAFHVFFSEQVDVAIFETNSGGTHDATNIVKPNVVGITRLGIDHVSTLGSTIESIAWHKSGIFKYQVPAFSSIQVPAATTVLKKRATEKLSQLNFVNVDDKLPADVFKPVVQRENASLALALSSAFLQENAPQEDCEITAQDISRAIELFTWPGRFQQINNANCQWFLDSAHNRMSLSVVGKWFAETTMETKSHASERDGRDLVKEIARCLQENGVQMQHVIFCAMEESKDLNHNHRFEVSEEMRDLYAATWRTVDSTAQISLKPSIKEALSLATTIADRENGMRTLVTGSSYLVGAALYLLKSRKH
ncbi:hypothetical protein G7Y89_g1008 [Cudoniella acicularis]|uniref:tetrahydrofolate synthase n=1 Tax=Cudoniella acicularis TaxID=354080 RepID=A0A8H4RW36_9HELO|nr:hypothetical protein G7Y89_g1008 [Cudoniella acicularis]